MHLALREGISHSYLQYSFMSKYIMVVRNEGSSVDLGYAQSLANWLYSIEFAASG